jgi:hypothetical protein
MRAKESAPLWVWIAVWLMVLGAVGYIAAVFLTEYVMKAI